jgi:predicted RNase H-like HicB family nuclease
MNPDLQKQAEELAARRYSMFVFRDTTTDDEPIYVAINPELEGCFAQGETSQEARENLNAFRVDYIYHLLSHGLSVPDPVWKRTKHGHIEQPLATAFGEHQQEDDSSTSGRIAELAVL